MNEVRNPDPVFVSDEFGEAKVRSGADHRFQIALQTFRQLRGRVRQGQVQRNEVVFLIGRHQQPWFGGAQSSERFDGGRFAVFDLPAKFTEILLHSQIRWHLPRTFFRLCRAIFLSGDWA